MAETHEFPGSTHHFGPPKGEEDRVGWLHFFTNGRAVVSAWRPTEQELAKLNAGESIYVSILSGSRQVMAETSPNVFEPVLVPIAYPMFVGCESEVAAVVSDTGKVWKR